MSSSFLSLRAVTRCVFLSVFCLPYLVSAHAQSTVSAADLAKLQENINAMRTQYEQRISALEEKLKSLQQQNTSLEKKSTTTTPPIALPTEIKPQRASNEPKNLAPGPALHSGLSLPKIGSFTPEISLIIDGKYSNQTQNPDAAMQGFIPSGASNIPRGFSLGETELVLAGTVDNLFRAEARLVLSQNANGTSVNAEEVFFETLGLPVGL